MFSNDEKLVRLIWNPRDFDQKTGKLKASAFAPRDLVPYLDDDGEPRYISMDILRLISKASVDWRIASAQSEKERRREAKFLEYSCGELRELLLDDQPAFEVFGAPLLEGDDGPDSPANPAHVGVRSTSPDPVDEELRQAKIGALRNLLLELHQAALKAHLYGDVFPDDTAA